MTTKEIEHIAYKHFWRKGWYGVFEVAVPRAIINKYHRERVDFLTYETTGIYRAYEIKRDKADFYSGCAWSWIGNYNYFIMPYKLYIEVEKDIPKDIGVWVVREHSKNMECVKKPKKRELLCSSIDMQFAILQALSREYKKYRNILQKQDNRKSKSNNKNKQKEIEFDIDEIFN
jgi:hypothetical protein